MDNQSEKENNFTEEDITYQQFLPHKPGDRVLITSTDKYSSPVDSSDEEFGYTDFRRIKPGQRYPHTSTQAAKQQSQGKRASSPSTLSRPKRLRDEDKSSKTKSENSAVLDRILQELIFIKQQNNEIIKDIKKIKSHIFFDEQNSNILPSSPFENKDEFIAFDKSLSEDEEKINLLKVAFSRLGGNDVREFIRRNLSKLLNDENAQNFCWTGTKEKMGIKYFNTILALKGACMTVIPNSTETIVEHHIKRYFQYAKQKINSSLSVKQ